MLERLDARGADPVRLAHHAEAAGDAAAVLRHAPAAAERAARLGAHREAAQQYARALRWADALTTAQRAELLERRSYECYLTHQIDEAITAREQALACRRELGDGIAEGDALRWLSRLHVAAGPEFEEGLTYCTERDLDSWVLYILAWRAVAERDAGAYDAAVATASKVLRHPGSAPIARIPALAALGLAYARQGDIRRVATVNDLPVDAITEVRVLDPYFYR